MINDVSLPVCVCLYVCIVREEGLALVLWSVAQVTRMPCESRHTKWSETKKTLKPSGGQQPLADRKEDGGFTTQSSDILVHIWSALRVMQHTGSTHTHTHTYKLYTLMQKNFLYMDRGSLLFERKCNTPQPAVIPFQGVVYVCVCVCV